MHRNEAENMTDEGLFPTSPPYAVITAEFVNALQEEIMNVITSGGLPLLSQNNDTKNQLLTAMRNTIQPYDYVVNNQTTFEALFVRSAANTYDIDSSYKSVYFRNVTGGYAVPQLLSGGDTWGDLYTNNCVSIEFENGAYINMGDAKGNLTIETDNCYLRNVDIRGIGSVAAGVVESFKLDASHVTFDNCKCSNRLSNIVMYGFLGSVTDLHNITSKYTNCSVFNLNGSSSIVGFTKTNNIHNCIVYNLDGSSGIHDLYGFHECDQISGCQAYNLDTNSGDVHGFFNCEQISSCIAYEIDSGSGDVYGFYNCDQISACQAYDLDSTSGVVYGFYACAPISACQAYDLDSTSGVVYGFYACALVSSCYVYILDSDSNNAYGFHTCEQISSCRASDIDSDSNDAYGFHTCNQISSCQAEDIDSNSGDAYGFHTCDRLSSCYADNIDSVSGTANGFNNCNFGAAFYSTEANNANNDWIDTNDAQIVNQHSCSAIFT